MALTSNCTPEGAAGDISVSKTGPIVEEDYDGGRLNRM
jgi:hypothetical protein